MSATTLAELTVDHLGDSATEADLAAFVAAARAYAEALVINVRVGPVTEPERGAINILTPEERRVVLLAAARAKAAGIVGDASATTPGRRWPASDEETR
jgi:hypothetical protein